MSAVTLDFSVALAYLTWLDPRPDAVFSFQTFADNPREPEHKRGALTRVLHAKDTAQLAALLPELKQLNDNSAGIFVTINETDGRGRKG